MRRLRRLLPSRDVALGVLGLGLVGAGLWWVSPPAALIVVGALLLLAALLLE